MIKKILSARFTNYPQNWCKSMLIGLVLILGHFGFSQTDDRSVLSNAGEPLSNGTLQLNFTMGEPIVGLVGSTTSIDQGFWASQTIIVPVPFTENPTGIAVYPVPVDDILNIATRGQQLVGLQVFSVDRRMVFSKAITATTTAHQIDLSTISRGVYVLQLFLEEANEALLFKIIKE